MIKQITSVLIFVLLAGCGESKVTDTAKDIYGQLKERSPEYLEAVAGAYTTSLEMTSGHMVAAAQKWKERPVGICEMTDDEMFDFRLICDNRFGFQLESTGQSIEKKNKRICFGFRLSYYCLRLPLIVEVPLHMRCPACKSESVRARDCFCGIPAGITSSHRF